MDKEIFILNDKISFRKCDLFYEEDSQYKGDCTNFYGRIVNGRRCFFCNQSGIHYHCTKHPAIELYEDKNKIEYTLCCPKCNEAKYQGSSKDLLSDCLKAINSKEFTNAKLIKVADWYYPEISKRIELGEDSRYWMKADVKKDKEGDTIVVLYIGQKGDNEKVQFFIKPEKKQLSNDYKDLDPAKILSKIEVRLKDRLIVQDYDDKDED